jgi:hypothetical protein
MPVDHDRVQELLSEKLRTHLEEAYPQLDSDQLDELQGALEEIADEAAEKIRSASERCTCASYYDKESAVLDEFCPVHGGG